MTPRARPRPLTRRRVLQVAGTGLALAAAPAVADAQTSTTSTSASTTSNTITIPALPSARTTELDRTQDSLSASELRTTGFYLPADTALNIGDTGSAKVTLGEQAQPMPYFVLGRTGEDDFQRQLDERATPYAELVSPHVMITVERASALTYRAENHTELLRSS